MTKRRRRHDEIADLFRQHLKEHHNIDTDERFKPQSVTEHLEGKHTLIPVSVFSNKKLSALEAAVKYLRENEQLGNSRVATLLGRTPAATWITYRNASQKIAKRLVAGTTEMFIPTEFIASAQLSVLESVSSYLHEEYGLSYSRIGRLLNRDARTVWTVCYRARKKLGK